jgi:signal transduction histidine kinase
MSGRPGACRRAASDSIRNRSLPWRQPNLIPALAPAPPAAARATSTGDAVDVDSESATHIFRILQEALTNIARHAGATRVRLTASHDEGRFVLEIRDNGRGISDAELPDVHSLGLLGMHERARLIGASLTVARAGKRGTTVTVSAPLGEGEARSRRRKPHAKGFSSALRP